MVPLLQSIFIQGAESWSQAKPLTPDTWKHMMRMIMPASGEQDSLDAWSKLYEHGKKILESSQKISESMMGPLFPLGMFTPPGSAFHEGQTQKKN